MSLFQYYISFFVCLYCQWGCVSLSLFLQVGRDSVQGCGYRTCFLWPQVFLYRVHFALLSVSSSCPLQFFKLCSCPCLYPFRSGFLNLDGFSLSLFASWEWIFVRMFLLHLFFVPHDRFCLDTCMSFSSSFEWFARPLKRWFICALCHKSYICILNLVPPCWPIQTGMNMS